MRIPVIIVAGFLGSGKTTLLNHVLHNRDGVRVGVVVNDFGSVGIDAMSLSAHVDTMVSFGNGCLCCAIDTEDMGDTLAGLAEADLDVVLVEPSGLAEPGSVIRLVLANAGERLAYGGLLEVVDAAEFDETRKRNPEFDRHLGLADLVVLNKLDLVTEQERAERRAELERLGVPVLETRHGAIDPALLFDAAKQDRARQLSFDELEEHGDHSEHAHERYGSVTFRSETAMDPGALIEFLAQRPPELLRIKGFVRFDVPGYRRPFGLQTVGRHLRFHRDAPGSAKSASTELVLIGPDLDSEALIKRLRDCVAERQGTEEDLLPVLRYAH